jgi:hypothetical protein
MRRMVLIVALVLAATTVRATPASAHTCGQAVDIPLNKVSVITFGVLIEDKPVVEVDATVPKGFTVDSVRAEPGWTASHEGATIKVAGGEWPPFTCGFFQVTGKATREAVLAFPVVEKHADGTTKLFDKTDPAAIDAAQLVYVGNAGNPSAAKANRTGDSLRLLAVLLGVGGVVALASRKQIARAWRGRRGRGRAKGAKQTQRRPGSPSRRAPARRGSGSSRSRNGKRKQPRRSSSRGAV